MAKSLAAVWLATQGHSLYEHLTGQPAPISWERAARDRQVLVDHRAEALLCGCLYYYEALARRGAARAGLEPRHFRGRKARAMWEGEPDRKYRAYVVAEYCWAADEVLEEWARRRLRGEDARLFEAPPEDIARSLAERIVRLAEAREKLQEAEMLLRGEGTSGSAPLGGVPL